MILIFFNHLIFKATYVSYHRNIEKSLYLLEIIDGTKVQIFQNYIKKKFNHNILNFFFSVNLFSLSCFLR